VNDAIYYIAGAVVMLLGIAISIGLHELGHLLPAKRFGLRVPRFMIGFGPTLFSRTRGETEYGFKLIPLGGYVTMLGMLAPPEAFASRPVPKNSLAAWYLRFVEKYRGESELKQHEQHRAFYRLPAGKRLVVMFGGPVANLILGSVLAAIALFGIGVMTPTNQVASVVDCNLPNGVTSCTGIPVTIAKATGVASGDRLIAIGGTKVSNPDEIRAELKKVVGQSVKLDFERGQQHLYITAKIENQSVYNSETGKYESRPFLGLAFDLDRQPATFGQYSDFFGSTLGGTFSMIGQLPQQAVHAFAAITGAEKRNPSGAISVVGITKVAGDMAVESGGDWAGTVGMWLLTLASLNFALFAFNMIPVLPLDGGHILAALYGKAKQIWFRMRGRGTPRPVDMALLAPLTMVGWAALTLMGLLFVLADIIAPVSI
jgi:membrane-associated protease RseP (regulator of RpoE activity)